MQEINLALQLDEVNAILQVLGDLPTKSGAYPLVLKIKEQAEQQVKVDENVEQD
jgi:isocitrate dehydrogenase kinase/phosphatase